MGRVDPPRMRGRNEDVGAMRDPAVIVGTIEELRVGMQADWLSPCPPRPSILRSERAPIRAMWD
ncbi:MAG: hypothetical protein ACRDKT_01805 [Actinomycetota bacterium]